MYEGSALPASYLLQREDAARFRHICLEVALPIVLLGGAIGLFWSVEQDLPTPPMPVEVVRLLPVPPEHPRLLPPPKPVPEIRPVVRRVAPQAAATQVRRPAHVRSSAQAAGGAAGALAALHAQLAGFGDAAPDLIAQPRSLRAAPMSTASGEGSGAGRLSRMAATGSGGVGTGHEVGAGQAGIDLGERHAARVAGGFADAQGGGETRGAGEPYAGRRSLAEVQWVFDHDKSEMLSMFYSSAQRHPGLTGGKIVVSLSILPDGSVSRCMLVSSSIDDPQLEAGILAQIRRLNFGARQVPEFNYAAYPINFLIS